MGFRVYCDIKGCRKEMEPLLDKKTNEVFCAECDRAINNVTEFAKRQMVSLGQVRRETKDKKSFSFKCDSCERNGTPVLGKNKELLCPFCKAKSTNISKPFEKLLKDTLLKSIG